MLKQKKKPNESFHIHFTQKKHYSCQKTHLTGISDEAAMLKDRMRCYHNAFLCKNVLNQQLQASQHNKSILLNLFKASNHLYFVHLSVHQALKG